MAIATEIGSISEVGCKRASGYGIPGIQIDRFNCLAVMRPLGKPRSARVPERDLYLDQCKFLRLEDTLWPTTNGARHDEGKAVLGAGPIKQCVSVWSNSELPAKKR